MQPLECMRRSARRDISDGAQVRLSEVDWDETRDGREGEAQLDMLRAKADSGSTPAAVEAQVALMRRWRPDRGVRGCRGKPPHR